MSYVIKFVWYDNWLVDWHERLATRSRSSSLTLVLQLGIDSVIHPSILMFVRFPILPFLFFFFTSPVDRVLVCHGWSCYGLHFLSWGICKRVGSLFLATSFSHGPYMLYSKWTELAEDIGGFDISKTNLSSGQFELHTPRLKVQQADQLD